MKIAFLSPFFWPEPISTGKYNTILAEALVEQGHKVDFFCSHPFYPEWKPIIEAQAHRSVNVIRGGGFLKYSNSQVIKRLTLELLIKLEGSTMRKIFSYKKYEMCCLNMNICTVKT